MLLAATQARGIGHAASCETMAEIERPSTTISIGAALANGRFKVRELLGEGSTGRVYRVYDTRLEQDVALKSLARMGADEHYHLKREFRLLAGFSHPSVVQLYELFVEADACFFTMQLVAGEPLFEYVRGGARPGSPPTATGLTRALGALRQVAEGLVALHAAGHLHRDVKPSNVRMTPDDRAVLLDFGLATAGRRSFETEQTSFSGTLLYAPREQLVGAPEPASDWYALGATLFELLTGRLPFMHGAGGTLARKGSGPPRPSEYAEGIGPELDALVMPLLAFDPDERPSGEAVVASLSALARRRAPARTQVRAPAFVGREDALRQLADAFEHSREGVGAVWVHGPSGIGKSELVLRFLTGRRNAGAVVLAGRCRPQESVAFRSLDPVVDDLSRLWLELEPDAARRLVPDNAAALVRVFPVLARVPALAEATPVAQGVSDDELLRRAIAALREVLAVFTAERPLALWIDDAQWGDRGSVTLLRSLVRGPDAPRVLLVISHRSEEQHRSEAVDQLREALVEERVPSETIALPPLSDAESDALLQGFAGAFPLDAAQRAAVASGAGGSPFLLLELARHLEVADVGTPVLPEVNELLSRRLAPLHGAARRLLELTSVASRPFGTRLLLSLAGVGAAGQPIVLDLCAQSLLRASESEELEPYHDRIREAVLAGLGAGERRARHRAIAEGLSATPDADAGLLVEHWLGAAEDELAANYAVRAGTEAAGSLAFDRASDYFGLALRLRGSESVDWALQRRRAEALASAGRGAEAGAAFERAVAAARATDPHAAREASLLGRAAEQYLYAGLWNEGLDRTREVLQHLKIAMPASSAAATRRATGLRLRFLLRRRPGERLRSGPPDPVVRERLAMLFGCAKGTALLFPKLSDYLGMIYLREALAAGDEEHVAIALAKEASLEGALPSPRWRTRAARLLATAHRVAERSKLPHVIGTVLTCEAAYAYFCAEWAQCVERSERAIEVFRNECAGESESLSITITFLLPGLVQCGELRRVRELLPEFMADAQRRGDLTLARVIQAGDASLAVLAGGDADGVIASAERLRALPTSNEEASLPYHYALATWRANLYRGDVAEAWRRIDEAWEPLRVSGMLSFEIFAVRLGALRAATAVLVAAQGGTAGFSPARLIRLATAQARRIGRSRLAFAAPWAAVLRAGLANATGNTGERNARLGAARAGFAAARMPLHMHACTVLGGAAGADERCAADAFMAMQGVREPKRFAAALIPGVISVPDL